MRSRNARPHGETKKHSRYSRENPAESPCAYPARNRARVPRPIGATCTQHPPDRLDAIQPNQLYRACCMIVQWTLHCIPLKHYHNCSYCECFRDFWGMELKGEKPRLPPGFRLRLPAKDGRLPGIARKRMALTRTTTGVHSRLKKRTVTPNEPEWGGNAVAGVPPRR